MILKGDNSAVFLNFKKQIKISQKVTCYSEIYNYIITFMECWWLYM